MSDLLSDQLRCLAIDFGGSKVSLGIFEATGEISTQTRFELDNDMRADDVLKLTHEAGSRLLDGRSAVIGAVSPGVISDEGILLAPNVAGWEAVRLRASLQDYFDQPQVFVGNDVKAAALAESRSGQLSGIDVGLYVNLGTGVAVAIVIEGQVLHGAHGASGEVGYNLLGKTHAGRSTFEEMVGSRALVTTAKDRCPELALSFRSPQEVFHAAQTSLKVSSVVADFLDELASQLQQMVNLIDPRRIVFGGGLSGSANHFLRALGTRINSIAGDGPELVVSAYGSDSSLHGARLIGLGA